MKIITHCLFSTGLTVFVAFFVFKLSIPYVFLVGLFTWGMQYVIDVASHETYTVRTVEGRRHVYRRTWFLHSPLGALVIAVVFTGIIVFVTRFSTSIIVDIFVCMLLASYSHLFLDWLTENGIYLWRGKRVRKKNSWRYNDAGANMGFSLIGLFMIIYVLASALNLLDVSFSP